MQRQRVLKGAISSEHVVQLFDAPESRGESVAAFLRKGLLAGTRLLVVAKAANLCQIERGLEPFGMSVAQLAAAGHLHVIDGHATLDAIMRHGSPDAALFTARVGDLVARLAADSRSPLHIYGELVEILAEEGNFPAAEELEELWNQLGAKVCFSLLCGYSSAHFAAPDAGEALQRICARHTRVHQHHADLLGKWLLGGHRPAGTAS